MTRNNNTIRYGMCLLGYSPEQLKRKVMFFDKINALVEPKNDKLAEKVGKHYFRDALATKRINKQLTASQLQFAIFAYMPGWVDGLMKVRNYCVAMFGFSVGTGEEGGMAPKVDELAIGERAGFLVVTEKTAHEIISFAEDKHMAFYLSVAIQGDDVVVSTLVNQKTVIGRLYVNFILPFHYVIARSVINNAIRAGRI